MIESSDNAARKSSNQRFQKDNGKRILVVDDEYDISLTIKVILEENGFKVDSFNDASQALENFLSGIYDLVILDVLMQGMSGFSLYNEIRKLDDKVSICFLTAADESYYETLKESHPNIDESCIIHKPVDNDSLLLILVACRMAELFKCRDKNGYNMMYYLKRNRKLSNKIMRLSLALQTAF